MSDVLVEGNEDIQFTLAAPTAGLTIGDADGDTSTQSTHTYTIIDDDGALIEFELATASDAESSGGNIPNLIVTGTVGAGETIDVTV
ncbi:MAG: hypothetical protein ACYTAO_23265, partial [Planctomycetota bacterium]